MGQLMADAARLEGVQLVVKPHPIDADSYDAYGIRTLKTEDIWAAGSTLYQFLGAAAGVISDYSSIWVDYLAVRGSVALYCPDLEEYSRERRLNSPPLDLVADRLFLRTAADVQEFFSTVGRGELFRRTDRDALKERIGFVHCDHRVETLFRELGLC